MRCKNVVISTLDSYAYNQRMHYFIHPLYINVLIVVAAIISLRLCIGFAVDPVSFDKASAPVRSC